MTEWFSWRWMMFVNVPIGVVVFLVGRLVLLETDRRQGTFDLAGALTSTLGMTAIVFGLVEAGGSGWTQPRTFGSLAIGAGLLVAFVAIEKRAVQPILPLRLIQDAIRNSANAARGLVFAGMYGMFFFMSQFLQDLQGYSPLRTGVMFLVMPTSVFVTAQVTSRILMRRFSSRSLIVSGISLASISLLQATQLHLDAGVVQILATLLLLGTGSGVQLVSLTSASLTGIQPGDAGAASGLVNVAQQIGAALGLAALVTVFEDATHHS